MEGISKLINNDAKVRPDPCKDPTNTNAWAHLGWYLIKRIIYKIRRKRLSIDKSQVDFKSDGSPFTKLEKEVEEFCFKELKRFYPPAIFIGEESYSGGKIEQSDYLFVIDPIDGTRAFLSNFDTYSVTIGILKGRKPVFSIIANPSTGDVAFRVDSNKSQIASLNHEDGNIQCYELPLITNLVDRPILINMHPSLGSFKLLTKLYALWESQKISLVKSVSGSPSLQIIEVAKGSTVYINTWDRGETMPFDLVSAYHILEGSGGILINFDGELVDPWVVSEPFIATLAGVKLDKIRRFISAD